jgi:hypothetical protein
VTLGLEARRVRALPEYRPVHLANTSGCGEDSFGRSDKRGIRSKGKVGGQLRGFEVGLVNLSRRQARPRANPERISWSTRRPTAPALWYRLEMEVGG